MVRFIVISWLTWKLFQSIAWTLKKLVQVTTRLMSKEFWVKQKKVAQRKLTGVLHEARAYSPLSLLKSFLKVLKNTAQQLVLTAFAGLYYLFFYVVAPHTPLYLKQLVAYLMTWYWIVLKLYFLGVILWLLIVYFLLDITWYDEQKRLIEEYEKKNNIKPWQW